MTVLVGIFSALLAGLGVGSGGFYLLYLTEVLGLAQYTAQGANLLFFTAATLASTLTAAAAGRLSFRRLLPLLVLGAVGSAAGVLLTRTVPPEAARRALGALLALGGISSLLRHPARHAQKKKRKAREIP